MEIDEDKIRKISRIFNSDMWSTIHREYTHIIFSRAQLIDSKTQIDYLLCCNNYNYGDLNFSFNYNFEVNRSSYYVYSILKFEAKYFRDIINIFNIDFNKTKILEKIREENLHMKRFDSSDDRVKKYKKFLEDINIPFEFE